MGEIEYGHVLYSGAAPSCLDALQAQVEDMSNSKFTSLLQDGHGDFIIIT